MSSSTKLSSAQINLLQSMQEGRDLIWWGRNQAWRKTPTNGHQPIRDARTDIRTVHALRSAGLIVGVPCLLQRYRISTKGLLFLNQHAAKRRAQAGVR